MDEFESLEARVLVLSRGGRRGLELFAADLPPHVRVETATELKGDINQYDTVIVLRDEPILKSAEVPLLENLLVPVVFNAYEELLPEQKSYLINAYNLYDAVSEDPLDHVLDNALAIRRRLVRYGRDNPRGVDRLKGRQQPKLIKAVVNAQAYYESRKHREAQVQNAQELTQVTYANIIQHMLVHDSIDDPQIRQQFGAEVIKQWVPFLDTGKFYSVDRQIKKFGDGESGEDDVNGVRGMVSLPIGMVRKQPDQPGVSSELLGKRWLYRKLEEKSDKPSPKNQAEQRYNDAQFFLERGGTFTPRRILRPIHFSDYPESGRTDSLLILQYVPGEPARIVLEKLNMDYASSNGKRSKKVDAIRRYIAAQCLAQSMDFAKADAPMIKTERRFDKPEPDKLLRYYMRQLKKIPDAINRHTKINFSNREAALFKQAVKLYERLKVRPEDIVRYRDASLGNTIVTPEDPWTVDDLVEKFHSTAKLDCQSLDESLVAIDHQHQWRHVLDDPSQIFVWYEARFLLYDEARKKPGTQIILPKKIKSKLLRLRDEYLDGIGNPKLKEDEGIFTSMLFYRSARKMNLFLNYWGSTTKDHAEQLIDDVDVTQRYLRFMNNIAHYNVLSSNLAHQWASSIASTLPKSTSKKALRAVESARLLSSQPLTGSMVSEYNRLLDRTRAHNAALDSVRAYVLRSSFKKLQTSEFALANSNMNLTPYRGTKK